MKLADLLLGGGSRSTSFQGFGDPGGAAPGDAGDGGGEWWQDEAGAWHFGGEAQRWWRDEHHQWHQGGEFQLWRQDEQGNWHEVNEDHPKNSEDELMMEGPSDMGDPQQDIKDLDALNGAMTEDFPPMDPSFTPSIENIITKTGPSELGKNVAELSRALGQLKDDVNSNLSQDRIAAMTSEDVPNMVTPVADSLKEVIRNAKSLKDHLTAISDAAYSIVGSAAEDAERRLSGAPLETEEEGPEDEMGHGYDEYGGYGGYGDEYGGGYGGGYGGEYGGYGGEYGGYGDHGHGGAHGDMGHGVAVSAIPGMAKTPRS
ncbi:unnamed protein product [Effrenium voratum]|nr:unnamed protein product [Effrenium voratum]